MGIPAVEIGYFLEDVIEVYYLHSKATEDAYVCIEVQKGMYVLPQARLLAQQLLKGISRVSSHQAFGSMNHTQSLSSLWWTTLVLSM